MLVSPKTTGRPDEPPDAPADRYEMLSLLLIEGVQYVESPTAA